MCDLHWCWLNCYGGIIKKNCWKAMLFFWIIGWIFGVYLMYFSHLTKWRADLNESLILFKVYDHWPLDPWRTDPNEKSSILEILISFKIGWTFYSEGVIRMKNFTTLFFDIVFKFYKAFWPTSVWTLYHEGLIRMKNRVLAGLIWMKN